MPALKPEIAIRKILVDDASIAAVVGTRVYCGFAPQSSAMPYIIIRRGATDVDHYMGGKSGLKTVDVDIWIIGEGYESLTDLGELIEAELYTAGHRQTVTISAKSITFARLFMQDQSDEQEFLGDGTGKPRRQIYQRWQASYQN